MMQEKNTTKMPIKIRNHLNPSTTWTIIMYKGLKDRKIRSISIVRFRERPISSTKQILLGRAYGEALFC
jgi:hypothetical protein